MKNKKKQKQSIEKKKNPIAHRCISLRRNRYFFNDSCQFFVLQWHRHAHQLRWITGNSRLLFDALIYIFIRVDVVLFLFVLRMKTLFMTFRWKQNEIQSGWHFFSLDIATSQHFIHLPREYDDQMPLKRGKQKK